MRSVSSAIWTLVEPMSASLAPNFEAISRLRSVVMAVIRVETLAEAGCRPEVRPLPHAVLRPKLAVRRFDRSPRVPYNPFLSQIGGKERRAAGEAQVPSRMGAFVGGRSRADGAPRGSLGLVDILRTCGPAAPDGHRGNPERRPARGAERREHQRHESQSGERCEVRIEERYRIRGLLAQHDRRPHPAWH